MEGDEGETLAMEEGGEGKGAEVGGCLWEVVSLLVRGMVAACVGMDGGEREVGG